MKQSSVSNVSPDDNTVIYAVFQRQVGTSTDHNRSLIMQFKIMWIQGNTRVHTTTRLPLLRSKHSETRHTTNNATDRVQQFPPAGSIYQTYSWMFCPAALAVSLLFSLTSIHLSTHASTSAMNEKTALDAMAVT